MKTKKIAFVILSTLLFSCGKTNTKIDISYDGETQKGILLIDGKTKVKLPADSTSISISIESGDHTFKLNKDKAFSCAIDSEGGILNLNKERFVSIPEIYSDESMGKLMNSLNNSKPDYLIVDSLVYVYKKDSLKSVSDAEIKRVLDQKYTTMKLFEGHPFIKKDWDYGLSEDLPEQIEIRGTASMETRTKVMPLYLFRFMAMLTPQYFEIRNIKDIQSGKTDKTTDKAKEKQQMDME
jgi:hypothetical protein